MIKSYLITALRRMYRQRGSTLINLSGLSLGILCALVIFLIVRYESGFDRFHTKRERIYRVVTELHANDVTAWTQGTPLPLGPALRNDFPSLEKVTVTFGNRSALFEAVREDGTRHRFQQNGDVGFVEPEFFQVFDFPWLAGAPARLAEPNTAALTESAAQTFFGTTDVLGRTLRMDNQTTLAVVGLLKDFPTQTDFPFTVVASLKTILKLNAGMNIWGGVTASTNTWVILPPGMPASELQDRLPAFKAKYYPDQADVNKARLFLEPLGDVHFDGRFGNYARHTISHEMLLALSFLGLLVLVTACINFINMATAQSLNRAREVGVRKTLGAERGKLIRQHLAETLLLTLLAALCAGALAEVILPFGSNLLGYKLTLAPLHDAQTAGFLVLLVVIVGCLSGLYPALVLSGFNPVAALKGQSGSSLRKGLVLRRGLVVAQFAISQALIFGTIVLTAQLDFWRQKDLGFATEATVVVELPHNEAAVLGTLRSRLLQNSRVHEVSFSSVSPMSDIWNGAVYHRLHGSEEEYITDFKYADAHYASLFGLKFVAGRNYQEADSSRELVVNEAFARGLSIAPQDLIGKTIEMVRMQSNAQIREPLPVVGIVKDFNERPLQDGIYPTLLTSYRPFYYQASVKVDIHNMPEAVAHIERCWSAAYPDFLFQAQFLDERIAGYYKDEETTAGMVRILTGVAIAIGMMGLFGLVSFMAARRTKEIGVRKVLGAGVVDILLLFLKEFALLILIAFAVAAPAAYFMMSRWLEDFTYRITPGPGVFALTLAVTCVVAALSVGYRVVRASLANPVSALRYE